MENKKSFILYSDLLHTVNKMPNDKAGELFKHILEYVNDNDPQTDDLIVNLTFEPIKQQLKRDLERWQDSKNKKSINGDLGNLKRWNKDLYEKVIDNKITLNEAKEVAKSRKESQGDSSAIVSDSKRSQKVAKIAVNDNVSVNVNDNVINNIYRKFAHLSLTIDKFKELNEFYTKAEIDKTLDAIENYSKNKNYKSLYLTCKNWLKKEFGNRKEKPTQDKTTFASPII